jgi:hypothetical protein
MELSENTLKVKLLDKGCFEKWKAMTFTQVWGFIVVHSVSYGP